MKRSEKQRDKERSRDRESKKHIDKEIGDKVQRAVSNLNGSPYVDKYVMFQRKFLKKLKNFMLMKKYFNLNILLTKSIMRSLWNVHPHGRFLVVRIGKPDR